VMVNLKVANFKKEIRFVNTLTEFNPDWNWWDGYRR